MHLAHFVWDLMENVVWMSRTFQSAHLTASIQGYFSINVFEGENRSTKNSTLEQSNPGNVWWAADHKFFMNISNISTVGYFIRSYFREIFKPSDGCRTCMYVLHDVVRPTSYPQYCTQLFAHILYIYICGIAVSTADILAIPERKETRSLILNASKNLLGPWWKTTIHRRSQPDGKPVPVPGVMFKSLQSFT